MEIIVNDTNIFIDLYDCNLLEAFFKLPYRIHTVDFVVAELTNVKQREAVEAFIVSNDLTLKKFTPKEVNAIYEFAYIESYESNLSITDCSVLFYAKGLDNAKLLTGDSKLRSKANKDNVDVSGILFVFDKLVKHGIIEKTTASSKLEILKSRNIRLPQDAVNDRINKWSKGEDL